MTTAMVYRYRVPTRVDSGRRRDDGSPVLETVRVPEPIREQLLLAHRMRNELVAAQRAYDDARWAVWATFPGVAEIDAQLAPVEEEIGELVRQAGREHSADQSVATRPDTAARLRELQGRARELRQARRQAQGRLAEQAAPLLAELAPLRAETRTDPAVVAIRQRYSESGLYWGTYNAVIADHVTAAGEIKKKRMAGRMARLTFHRWDGTGTLSVQLIRGHGPDCGCEGCARRAVARWRVEDAPGGMVATHRPRGGQPTTYPAEPEQAMRRRVAEQAGVPARAVRVERRPGRRKDDPPAPHLVLDTDRLPAGGPGPKDPPRTPELIASGGGKWAGVLTMGPWEPPDQHQWRGWSDRRLHGTLTWGIGADKPPVELPVTLHRMMPADADICEAQLTVTRTGSQYRMQVAVTCLLPAPEPRTDGARVAVHCGWRQLPDGSARVGVWRADVPLAVPEALADVVVAHDGGWWGEVIAPARWLDVAGRPASLQGIRDTEMAPVADKLAGWLDQHPQLDPSPRDPDRMLTGARVRQWRSQGRLAALTHRWASAPPDGEGAEAVVALLREWRRRDLHLWDWQANEGQQTRLRRDDRWRAAAAWLAGAAGMVVVDDADLAQLRRRPARDDQDPVLPGVQQGKARARAALLAPGELRAAVAHAATRDGVPVQRVPAEHLTRTCPHCGAVGDAHPRYAAAAVVTCQACSHQYDQDWGAAGLMLDRASAPMVGG